MQRVLRRQCGLSRGEEGSRQGGRRLPVPEGQAGGGPAEAAVAGGAVGSAAVQNATERLQVLYDLSRRLASFDDLDALLRDATRALRDVFQAEGTAILLLDKDGTELRFPVASQAESAASAEKVLHDLRFPAREGIAGWVLAHGQSVAVDDVNNDPRFYPGVAKATAARITRTMARTMPT